MPEVYSSAETTLELLDPITGAIIMAIPFLRDDSFSESPTYGPRGYHRSAAVTAARLRSKGTITIRKDAESMAFANECERWQKGVIWYPMGSDLKGKRFRQPHVRKVMTQPDGTKEYRTAYDVRLSDRTLSRAEGGIVSESFTFDVQGGFDTPGSDHGEPLRSFDFHRTGSATYWDTTGAFKTAGDGEPRYGFAMPPATRNLILNSGLQHQNASTNGTTSIMRATHSISGVGDLSGVTWIQGASANILNLASFNVVSGALSGLSGKVLTLSYWVESTKLGSFGKSHIVVTISGTTYYLSSDRASWVTTSPGSEPDWLRAESVGAWGRSQIVLPALPVGTVTAFTIQGGYRTSADFTVKLAGFQLNEGATALPHQPTNATGLDYAHPLNGAGLVTEGEETNYIPYSRAFENTTASGWNRASIGGVTTGQAAPDGSTTACKLIDNSNNALHYIDSPTITVPSTTVLSAGVFAKAAEISMVHLQFVSGAAGFINATFDLVAGTGNGTNSRIYPIGNGWYFCQLIYSGAAITSERLRIHLRSASGITYAGTGQGVYLWEARFGVNPLFTSIITTNGEAVKRYPDLVGLQHPHNLLKHSEAFGESVWTNIGITSTTALDPRGYPTAATMSLATGGAQIRQVTGKTWNGAYTGSVWLKGATGTENVTLFLKKGDAGANVINTTFTLTTEWRRYSVTIAATTGEAVCFGVARSTTSSTVDLAWMQVTEGSHPGAYVKTTSVPILPPLTGPLDDGWHQNGAVEFDLIPPPLSSGKIYALFCEERNNGGSYLATLSMTRSHSVTIDSHSHEYLRKHNAASSGTAGTAVITTSQGSIWDGAKHRIRLEWVNYTLNGARNMRFSAYVDGVLAGYEEVSATKAATSWAPVNVSRLVAGGDAFSTPSRIKIGRPTLPLGAVAA